jgi:isoleucyl-tRNA synthetase
LPLAKLTVVAANAGALGDFAEIIADELNVKGVELVELTIDSGEKYGVTKRLTVNARAAGPRLGKAVQAIIGSAKGGDWSETNGVVTAGGVELVEGEYSLELVAAEDSESTNLVGILPGGGFVLLDGNVTPELAAEGLARDLIRAVQSARKDADFDVSDRISLTVSAQQEVIDAAQTHSELVKSETLTLELTLTVADVAGSEVTVGEDLPVKVSVAKL